MMVWCGGMYQTCARVPGNDCQVSHSRVWLFVLSEKENEQALAYHCAKKHTLFDH